jgi:ATP-dependent Lon protease
MASSDLPETALSPDVPVLPLRDVVVYPHMVIPLFVGREKSIRALDTAMQDNKQILLVAQKSADTDEPGIDDVHRIGTIANILQLLKLPDGTIKVLVEGAQRAVIQNLHEENEFFVASFTRVEDEMPEDEKELDILSRSILSVFDQYVKLNKKVPGEILTSLAGID